MMPRGTNDSHVKRNTSERFNLRWKLDLRRVYESAPVTTDSCITMQRSCRDCAQDTTTRRDAESPKGNARIDETQSHP